jgi:serine/threonine protein kinase
MSELFIAKAAGIEGFTRSFVLKRLRGELAHDQHAVAQFIDEARLQAELVHSNIVPVFDFGVVAGEYFMTQEYIAGRDLARLLERHAGWAEAGCPRPSPITPLTKRCRPWPTRTRSMTAKARPSGSSTATSRRVTSSCRSPAR